MLRVKAYKRVNFGHFPELFSVFNDGAVLRKMRVAFVGAFREDAQLWALFDFVLFETVKADLVLSERLLLPLLPLVLPQSLCVLWQEEGEESRLSLL